MEPRDELLAAYQKIETLQKENETFRRDYDKHNLILEIHHLKALIEALISGHVRQDQFEMLKIKSKGAYREMTKKELDILKLTHEKWVSSLSSAGQMDDSKTILKLIAQVEDLEGQLQKALEAYLNRQRDRHQQTTENLLATQMLMSIHDTFGCFYMGSRHCILKEFGGKCR